MEPWGGGDHAHQRVLSSHTNCPSTQPVLRTGDMVFLELCLSGHQSGTSLLSQMLLSFHDRAQRGH